MTHWQAGPRATPPPPYPQPPGANDLSSRVSRLEVHQWHTAQDMGRIEAESLMRGSDVKADLTIIKSQMAELHSHIGMVRMLAEWAPKALRFLIAAILFALLVSGKISVEAVKTFLAVFGFQTG